MREHRKQQGGWVWRFGMCVLMAVLLTAGSAGPSAMAQSTRRGGNLIVVSGADATTLDPHFTGEIPSAQVQMHMYETLVTLDRNGRRVPGLAESWSFTDNGATLTLRLRPNVVFHDGQPFNAAAVKANFDRMLDRANLTVAGRTLFQTVDRVDVTDPRTVVLRMKEPTGAIIANLASQRAAMISPEAIRQFGRDLSRNVAGTGPFMLEEWRPRERLVVKAFDRYWGGRPSLDTITFRPAPNPQARVAALESGDAHIVAPLPPDDVDRLRRNENYDVVAVHGADNMHMPLVNLHAPLRDKRVRQALNYAIDKQALARVIFRGYATPLTDSPIAPGVWGHQSVGDYYPFDRAKARALLREAGYENGFKMQIIAPDGRYVNDRRVAEAVASYLKSLGIDVDLQVSEFGTFVGRLISGRAERPSEWSAALITGSVVTLDAEQALSLFRGTDWPPNGFNTAFYRNPEVDRLLARGKAAVDNRQRLEAYRDAQRLIMEDAPAIFLVAYQYVGATSKRVKNAWLHGVGAVIAKEASLER